MTERVRKKIIWPWFRRCPCSLRWCFYAVCLLAVFIFGLNNGLWLCWNCRFELGELSLKNTVVNFSSVSICCFLDYLIINIIIVLCAVCIHSILKMAGNVCEYKDCDRTRRKIPNLVMFKFPSDITRSRQWIINAGKNPCFGNNLFDS